MKNILIKMDVSQIKNWDDFHSVFAETFGFPEFYGRNMNAWIDCMTSLDSPDDGLTIHAPTGGMVMLQLENVNALMKDCPNLYEAIVECSAFVNWRRIEVGEEAVLALSFHKA